MGHQIPAIYPIRAHYLACREYVEGIHTPLLSQRDHFVNGALRNLFLFSFYKGAVPDGTHSNNVGDATPARGVLNASRDKEWNQISVGHGFLSFEHPNSTVIWQGTVKRRRTRESSEKCSPQWLCRRVRAF